jgi:hypothetical protein
LCTAISVAAVTVTAASESISERGMLSPSAMCQIPVEARPNAAVPIAAVSDR